MGKDNLLVIVGAGGGVQIGMPSTENITEDIVNLKCSRNYSIEEVNLISLILEHVIKRDVNYEDLINILENLCTFARDTFVNDPFHKIDIDITPFIKTYGNIDKTVRISWEIPDYAILSIYKRIFCKINEAQERFDFNNNHKWYKAFYERINEISNVNILTTNHDNSYKIVLDKLYNGFSGVIDNINGISRFSPNEFYQKVTNEPVLMSIHGSIHYGYLNESSNEQQEKENIDLYYFENPKNAYSTWSDEASHRISQDDRCFKMGPFVEGLNKMNKIIISPLFFYLSSLYKLILSCNKMLIIGYSFSDVHLNWYIKKFKDIHGANSKIIYVTYVKPIGDNSSKWMRLNEKQKIFLNHFGNSWNNLINSKNRDQFPLSDNYCCAICFDGFESFAKNGLEEGLRFLALKEK